jgi:hypothetical protein
LRLDSVRKILEINADRLSVQSQLVDHNNNAKISGFRPAIEAIWEIRKTGMFQVLCQSLLNMQVISLSVHEPIVVSVGVFNQFNGELA